MFHALSIVGLLVSSTAAMTEPSFSCDEPVVQYSDPKLVPLERLLTVRRMKSRPDKVLQETDREYEPLSPQRTAAFNRILIADTTKGGPYSDSIQIFTTQGEPLSWQIDLTGLIDDVEMRWLNEELLFMRAWSGRIVSTDLIFQLSTGTFLYAREANYGLLTTPCQQPEHSDKKAPRGEEESPPQAR